MKRIVILLVLACLLPSCTCGEAREALDTSANAAAQGEHLRVDLPQLGKNNQNIYHVQWGEFSGQPGRDCAVVLADGQDDDARQTEVYLLVDLDGKFSVYELGMFDQHVIPSGNLYAADLDDDGVDEIVYSGEFTGNGGTVAHVYKVTNGQIQLMYDASAHDDISVSKYGYTYEFLEGKRLAIKNEAVGYRAEQEISDLFASEYFNEAGLPISSAPVYFLTGDARLAVARDEDGSAVLKYMQYAEGDAAFGCTITTLKYNTETKGFDVTGAAYVPKGYFGWDKLLKESDWTYVAG